MRISPDEIKENVTYSGRMKSNRKGKFGKYSKKSNRRKCVTISQQSVREIKDIKKLVNNFLTHKFSAAGVSYIVRSRSRWRKILWFTAVIVSLTFMGYMTFNVIKEYMNFPKMLIREGNISPKLAFPAVTLCSLNPIINITSNRSSVYKLIQLKELLSKSQDSNSNETLQGDCYRHPLCQWSWFNETCFCVTTPCSTEFCLVENSTHCACSTNVCRDFKKFNASCSIDTKADRCICSSKVQYNNSLELLTSYKEQQYELDWIGIDPAVSDVMSLIRRSRTNDLMDVEEDLLPNVNDLMENGIKFDNLVISCSFEGQSCYRENFTVLYHPRYGRCYMFNYLGIKPSSESPVFAYNYGSSSGLRLILHVKKQNDIDLLNAEIGARVVIHDPYHLPFVAEDGINMRPHDMSAIEVKQSIVRRLEPPYGTCANDGRHLKFKQLGENPYSILGCQKACRHHYLMQACNCTKRIYNTGSAFYTRTTKVTYCKVDDIDEYFCMIKTIARIEKGKILCDCRPPCMETIYSTTVSSSEMNENYYRAVKSIRTFYYQNGTYKIINGTDQNLMVGVKVYYSTFQVDNDKEQASYSWETLIANIGGNLGFFMGLTLLTFMEVLEFSWDVITAAIRRYMGTKAKPDKRLQMFPSGYNYEN